MPSTATCIQQAINKYALASPEDPEGAEVPAADPGCQQRLLSFQMLRKLSNDSAPPPPLPQPSRAQEHRGWRDAWGPNTSTTTSALRLWALNPYPQGSPSCPGALEHQPSPDPDLSLHPGAASPPLGVLRQLVIMKSIFFFLTISIFLILT